jgi:hypothetical protein
MITAPFGSFYDISMQLIFSIIFPSKNVNEKTADSGAARCFNLENEITDRIKKTLIAGLLIPLCKNSIMVQKQNGR